MPQKFKFTPKGYHTLTTAIAVKHAADAIKFYKKVLGAKIKILMKGPDGSIVHSELQIGDSLFMLSDEMPAYNHSPQSLGASTVVLSVYVENADKTIKKAVANGSKLLIPPTDQFYGDRSGRIEDPFGHVWIISTHIEDVSDKEMQKRFKNWMKQSTAAN